MFEPKFFTLIKNGISREQIFADMIAGTIVGIVALPLAIAFAVASGVSPEKGIITAIVAGFIISLLGGSKVQIGGPTGAFIIILYGIIEQYGINGLLISTIMAGVILILSDEHKLAISKNSGKKNGLRTREQNRVCDLVRYFLSCTG